MKTMIFGGMAAAAFSVVSAYLGAAVSHADVGDLDSEFVAMANRDGFQSASGYTGLIGAAHQVCQFRMNGYSEPSVIKAVFSGSQLTDLATAAALVRDAEQVYCPGYYQGGGSSI